jgi:alkanesulfonate monooxygenase SsuD/methylene tetrahydromethanopterin reductase-like flavin-dependent oxidoreductase (luciferase family)
MKIGIGLPAAIPQVSGDFILDWAREADAGPFSSLGLIDRIVYANYEPLITLAAVAAVTQRARLVTTVLLAPTRSAALLAKQSASLDALSNGRLTLGLGVGARVDDFIATETPYQKRGKIFDRQLAFFERAWSGQAISDEVGAIGPSPVQSGGPEILLGGYSDRAIKRFESHGHGFIAGGGDPRLAEQFFRLTEQTWQASGRAGKPRLVGCAYFGLGEQAAERAARPILDYYSFAPERAQRIATTLPSSPEKLRSLVQAYAEIGADELILWPTIPELDQIQRLADVIG